MRHSSAKHSVHFGQARLEGGITRREFVRSVVATGVAVGLGAPAWGAETKSGDMIFRTLGHTGEKVPAIGLGGAHHGRFQDEQDSIPPGWAEGGARRPVDFWLTRELTCARTS